MSAPAVHRGEIWHVSLDPAIGSEQRKTRPCVVVQRDAANASSPTTIICPLTTAETSNGNVLNVAIRAPEGGLNRNSLVVCNQIRTVDRERISGRMVGSVSEATLSLIEEGLRAILDLGE